MTEYIIRWDGIAKQLSELKNSTPMYLWSKRIRAERLREPIVRCKDCKHLNCIKDKKGRITYYGCFVFRASVEPDGFCSCAKAVEE